MKKEKTQYELFLECSNETISGIDFLIKKYKTIQNMLINNVKDDIVLYHKCMIELITKIEIYEGFVEYNYMNYKLTKDWNEILKKYGGTVLLPCIK